MTTLCKSTLDREEKKLRAKMVKVLDWLTQRRKKEEEWRDEREGQLVICRSVKGTVSRDFLLQIFCMNHLCPSP
jgi:hypothetical protein